MSQHVANPRLLKTGSIFEFTYTAGSYKGPRIAYCYDATARLLYCYDFTRQELRNFNPTYIENAVLLDNPDDAFRMETRFLPSYQAIIDLMNGWKAQRKDVWRDEKNGFVVVVSRKAKPIEPEVTAAIAGGILLTKGSKSFETFTSGGRPYYRTETVISWAALTPAVYAAEVARVSQ